MSCETETVEVLREAGHKLTPQRLMILSALRHAEGHYTATEIYDQVRAEYPYVDISTVYRTLGVLKEMRLVSETNMGTGDTTYEWVREHRRHHHLICRDCDTVASLDHQYLEDLGAEILAESGFKPDIDHFAIFGLCAACQERSRTA
ncbi:MAG: transcriptional repressor [Chloroflexi bacterium]|nr:transcriptional repressor [Chloroflexota bacterium]